MLRLAVRQLAPTDPVLTIAFAERESITSVDMSAVCAARADTWRLVQQEAQTQLQRAMRLESRVNDVVRELQSALEAAPVRSLQRSRQQSERRGRMRLVCQRRIQRRGRVSGRRFRVGIVRRPMW